MNTLAEPLKIFINTAEGKTFECVSLATSRSPILNPVILRYMLWVFDSGSTISVDLGRLEPGAQRMGVYAATIEILAVDF